MKTTIEFLPAHKQQEIQILVELICEKHQVEMIILFGSYARGDWVEELYEEGPLFKYQSDYDVFIVTATPQLAAKIEGDNQLWDQLNRRIKTPVTIIAHDIDFFNRRLRKGQYFFSDIKKEGICLFNSELFQLAEEKELSLKGKQNLAKEDFNYYFVKAEKLKAGFQFYFDRTDYNEAAFLLHQTTENLYSAILLVLTRYKPSTHDLKKLASRVASIEQIFLKVFPQGAEEERHRFELLRKAYVDARYNRN